MNRRIGKFKISQDLINGVAPHIKNKGLYKLFGKMIIIRAEAQEDVILYTAISPLFYPVLSGDIIPMYKINTTQHYKDGKIFRVNIKVERI